MATPRLLHLSSVLLRRAHRRTFPSPTLALSPLLLPLRLSSLLRPLAGSPPPRLRFFCISSSAAAIEEPTAVAPPADIKETTTAAAAAHPWPEWEHFIDKLRTKGYFAIPSATGEDAEAQDGSFVATPGESAATMELNRLKNACLKFARERFDILRSLPKEDIQAIVDCGCPNLFRKSVNSAKRLRAFLTLDEGDVCNDCDLKGSCDKAYVIANEDEAARTVDLMRILLTYAINPASLSSENPPVKMQVQESARKLLSEFIKLSDTTIDPALPKPAVKASRLKDPSHKAVDKKNLSQIGEMKRGDWLCSNCNFLNFARNIRCLECKEDGPKRVNFEGAEMKLGDWTCPECQFMNFARNRTCRRCQGSRPKRELNPGEWECPSCDFLNFGRNRVCKKCNRDRPYEEASQLEDHQWRKPKSAHDNTSFKFGDDDDEADDDEDDEGGNKFVVSKRGAPIGRPGEWECPSCDFLNFARNKVCKKCNHACPNDKDNQLEDHNWRKPKSANNNTSFKYGNKEDDDDDDDDDDILMSRGGNRFVASKRATPAGRPGEWECPSCDFLNFARNKVCKKCNHASPNGSSQFEDHERRKPKTTSNNTRFKFGDSDDEADDDDEDDDILPVREGRSRFVSTMSKRSTPPERRSTSARKRDYSS